MRRSELGRNICLDFTAYSCSWFFCQLFKFFIHIHSRTLFVGKCLCRDLCFSFSNVILGRMPLPFYVCWLSEPGRAIARRHGLSEFFESYTPSSFFLSFSWINASLLITSLLRGCEVSDDYKTRRWSIICRYNINRANSAYNLLLKENARVTFNNA